MLGASALLLGTTLAAPASAEKPYRFSYRAPPECPTEEELIERVQAYASSAARVDDPAVLGISLDIAADGGSFLGTVRAEPPGQPVSTRVLPAATCDELAQAAALFVAILVDPEAGRPAAPGPAPAPVVASPLPPPAVPAEPSPPARAPRAAPGSGEAPPFRLGGFAQAEASGAVAPVTAYGVGLELDLESPSDDALSPRVALGAHVLVSPLVVEPEGSARFQLVTGRAAACPARARFRGVRMWMGPCVALELGQLTVTPEAVDQGNPARLFWAAAALTGRTELSLGVFRVAAEAGAAFPLISDTFHFEPGRGVVHRVPDSALLAALGVGVSFW